MGNEVQVGAVSQISKSPVREIRTPGSEGVGVTIGGSFDPVRKGRFLPLTQQGVKARLYGEVGNQMGGLPINISICVVLYWLAFGYPL